MHVSKIRLVVAAAACAGLLVVNATAASAATPATRVTPSHGLADAHSITVLWHAFSGKVKFITITECNKAFLTGGSLTHCDTARAMTVTGAHKGTGSFTVHTGTIGDQTCGTSETDEDNCVIAVTGSDASHVFITGQSATAALDFVS